MLEDCKWSTGETATTQQSNPKQIRGPGRNSNEGGRGATLHMARGVLIGKSKTERNLRKVKEKIASILWKNVA